MIMKLELKHLAPYLPYKLKVFDNHYDFVAKIYGQKASTSKGKPIELVELNAMIEQGRRYKPILHRLSDLSKEIEVNGEKFVPIEKLSIHLFPLLVKEDILEGEIDGIPYWVMEKLFEWHFDVFDLIPEGLAIDVNTLKNLKSEL